MANAHPTTHTSNAIADASYLSQLGNIVQDKLYNRRKGRLAPTFATRARHTVRVSTQVLAGRKRNCKR